MLVGIWFPPVGAIHELPLQSGNHIIQALENHHIFENLVVESERDSIDPTIEPTIKINR
jgi:hypothetical protein